MLEIKINASNTEEGIKQMQSYFGGTLTQRYGEYILDFNGDIGKGVIKCLTFDWGVCLMEFDVTFYKDLVFINDNSIFNPIHFSYVSKGQFNHRFSNNDDFTIVEQYHAAIVVGSRDLNHVTVFPKGKHIMLNNISVLRQDYLKKRLNNVELLNEKLHKVFVDDKNEDAYAHYSPIHLKMADYVNAIRVNDLQGMSRILHIKGEVYQLLSMHISGHDKFQTSAMLPPSLLNEELKTVRKLGELIIKDPALNYSLELLSFEAGLSQAKLQEGFKFLFARTVTEYIRHIRLKAARELMNTTDLSISQIVYSIGFTSRSYFSKIFKEKYGMTPHEFKKQILFPVNEVV